MSDTVIRGFVHADRGPLRALFDSAGADSVIDQLWGHRDSEAAVYLDPYIDAEPESLFIAEKDGRLVGYLTGCSDTADFPSESERMGRAIRDHKLIGRPRVMRFFGRSLLDIAVAKLRHENAAAEGFTDARWPAHLHIAVRNESRGAGVADALMRHWLARLEEAGVPPSWPYRPGSLPNRWRVRN